MLDGHHYVAVACQLFELRRVREAGHSQAFAGYQTYKINSGTATARVDALT